MSEREIRCPFGLINIAGLLKTNDIKSGYDVVGYEVTVPLFCHETYKIKPTLNRKLNKKYGIMDSENTADDGKFYQKKFRRDVLWDFGDGTKVEGYSVEHHYSKPGRYKISCTFYDINRCAWKNNFYLEVVVKEVIPTQISFVNPNEHKTSILCSKIEKVAQLEAMLSVNCKEDLKIQAKRIFSEQEIDNKSEEIGRSYKEVPNEILKFTRKYWTFLENKQQLVFQSDKVYGEKLTPNDLYTPNYIQLYGKFYYDSKDTDSPIKLRIYQVIPYKNIDKKLKTVNVLNPNVKISDILSNSDDYETYQSKCIWKIEIIQKYIDEQLPEDVSPIGKRAFVDIFYKNDYLTTTHNNRFSFYYDIEHHNLTKELLSSDNYLNINPLGLEIQVKRNDIGKVRLGISLDGFLRQLNEQDDWTLRDYYIDPYLMNGLVKGINLDFYFFPYIEYKNSTSLIEGTDIVIEEGEETDFVVNTPMYYVPKDMEILQITPSVNDIPGQGTASRYILERGVHELEKWLKRVSFALHDHFNCYFTVNVSGKSITFTLRKDSIIKPDEITIPTEKKTEVDVSELVNTYMSHPMFDETNSIKEFFNIILKGNDLLSYTLTKSNHFLDDYANIKTCYLSSLIQNLKMMGEEVLEYEKGAFEGVNDLRDFVRILSINHSELVGKQMKKPHDTTIQLDRIGKNVGDEIFVDDILTLQTNDSNFNKGKIKKLTRGGVDYDFTKIWSDGVDIIIHDKYTFENKIVNLRLANKATVSILDYTPEWGWNLLLPQKYKDCLYKLEKNKEYAQSHNGTNLYSTKELNRIKEIMKEQLRGYYGFYTLNPDVEVERKGNFLNPATITDKILEPDEWYSEWGCTHDILMKIIRDNGKLMNSEIVVDNDDLQRVYSRRMVFDDTALTGIIDTEIANINSTVICDGLLSYDYIISGLVKVYGCICGGEEEYLEIQLEDAQLIGEKDAIRIQPELDIMQFNLKIDENGVIHPAKQFYKLNAGDFSGNLTVSLCGKLSKNKGVLTGFLWDVSIDLYSIK